MNTDHEGSTERCTCGSRAGAAACCAPILAGEPAPTAERLMRSRFSAFRLGDVEHLVRSWHPDTRPADLDLEDPSQQQWRALQIVSTVAGSPTDATGEVEFRASYRTPEGAGLLHERSRFVRHEGRWVYLDGDILQ